MTQAKQETHGAMRAGGWVKSMAQWLDQWAATPHLQDSHLWQAKQECLRGLKQAHAPVCLH